MPALTGHDWCHRGVFSWTAVGLRLAAWMPGAVRTPDIQLDQAAYPRTTPASFQEGHAWP